MKKLILPLICGIFILFFSGIPPVAPNCGADLHFGNYTMWPDDDPIPIARIDVYNSFTGVTTTYDNPTFPFWHKETGGKVYVAFTFAPGDRYNASLLMEDEIKCSSTHVKLATSITVDFQINSCVAVYVDLIRNGPGDYNKCGD